MAIGSSLHETSTPQMHPTTDANNKTNIFETNWKDSEKK